ncbi:T9SS type A sorting domain-containing protein [bacterium]|nr:T9SS type A sorting domain-containing protein [bacterium]
MKLYSLFRLLLITTLTLLSFTHVTVAEQLTTTLNFDPPDISQINNYDQITVPEALNIGPSGSPSLPSSAVWLLLSPGHKAVSVELKSETWHTLKGEYLPFPVQAMKPISDSSPPEFTPPDPAIYAGTKIFPDNPISNLNTHLKRGYAMAGCLVWPVRWNPVDRSLEYLAEAELIIETAPSEREQSGYERFYRSDEKTRKSIADRVRNDEMLDRYPRRDEYYLESILIITDNELINASEDYANWWRCRGVQTHIATVSELCDEYRGRDDQEKIRTGISELYTEYNISYVILMGDTQYIPFRAFYVDPEVQGHGAEHLPADLYYAALDGSWNRDGDEYWGELDEADLLAEVALGRLPADSEDDVRRIMTKTMNYSDNPVVDDAQSALMVGEDLGWQIMGGDYMDELYYSSRSCGYRTVGISNFFRRCNLYDRDRVWSAAQDLAPLISQGYHLVNHLGHSSSSSNMKFSSGSLNEELITNNGVNNGHNIGFTQGCHAGAFDVDDCISEVHICNLETGFVGYISNSRSGWGHTRNTNGSSQHIHRQFIDAIFGEDIYNIGEAIQDAKEDLSTWVYGTMTWCYYTVNLFADPALDIWTKTPRPIIPEYSGILIRGHNQYDVTAPGIRNAIASLIHTGDEPEILTSGLTSNDGYVRLVLDEPVLDDIPIELSIIAHNYIPFRSEITVARITEPYPWVSGLEIHEIEGNGNEIIDAGETISINPAIRNLGSEYLEDVTVTITIEDEMIDQLNTTNNYPPIGLEGEVVSENGYGIIVSPHCGDDHDVTVRVEIEDGSGEKWSQNTTFKIHAPKITDWTIEILDQKENNNGRIDPGEEVDMRLSLANMGSGCAEDIVVQLVCDNDLITVIDDEVRLPALDAGQFSVFNETFRIRVSDECPDPGRVVLYLRINSDLGFYYPLLKDFDIGGRYYNFDNGEEEWEHYSIGDGWGDQWCISTSYNCTQNGSACLKLGPDERSGLYRDNLNCAVEIPEFRINNPAELVFWHKISAECYYGAGNRAFDGGFVEISVNNGEWEQLFPETDDGQGYPYYIDEGPRESPINEMPCYSDEYHWNQAIFGLTEFTGEVVKIRFHFASDRSTGKRGWMIDDIRFRLPREMEVPLELEGEIEGSGAYLTWTTPLPRRDNPVTNELIGYRVFREEYPLDTVITDIRYFDKLTGMPPGDYYYMVNAVYSNGESNPSNEIELYWSNCGVTLMNDEIPIEWTLSGSHPNPFNQQALIFYSVARESDIQLSIYDLNGRLIKKLTEGSHQAGNYQVLFDAKNMASGVYIVHYRHPDGFKSSRMVLLR